MDTVPYLAEQFNVEIPRLDLNPEDLYEMETYQAYAHASYVIRNSKPSPLVQGKLAEYSWPKEMLSGIGIGSVESYEDYLHKMTVTYGHKKEFLSDIDLARKSLFNENNLIYTVKDESGSPVGFAARDLRFEEKQEKYEKAVEALAKKFDGDEKGFKDGKAKLFRPRKYNNSAESERIEGEDGRLETRPKNTIFKKGSRLFNFDLAKKATPPLEVFEGQPDCVTAFAYGMKNATAIGSTHFTAEHLDLILSADPPVKHLVFTLDADVAGEKGTQSFVNLLEEKLGGHPGLKVEIRIMPEGSDDPDLFIRKCGIKAFRGLPKEDLFSWRVRQSVKNGEDPIQVANTAVPLILNETNMLFRREMARRLARATGVPEDVIWEEVMRRIDTDRAIQAEQKNAIFEKMMSEARKHPDRAHALVAQASQQMELVDKQKQGYDIRVVVDALDFVYDRAEKIDNRVGLYTGWPIFDEKLRGVPRFEKFISLPGKPNCGKSTVCDNLAWRLAEHNKDCIVLFHTADDSLYERHSRILGSKFNLPSELFEAPAYFLNNPEAAAEKGCPNFEEIYPKCKWWLRGLMESEKMIVADVNLLPPSFPALGRWIADLRKRFPDKHIVVMEDNFHLLELPGYDAGEAKVAASSHYIKKLCTNYQVTVIATMEITKSDLAPGKRPVMASLKGSSAIPYDINANWVAYNDMADLMDASQLYWEDSELMENTVDADGIEASITIHNPILELIVDKNKIGSFKGTVFFRMRPDCGSLMECSMEEHATLRAKVAAQKSESPGGDSLAAKRKCKVNAAFAAATAGTDSASKRPQTSDPAGK